MAENRLQRELDTREVTSQKKSWQPASILPEVAERKGWSHRWVRTSTTGQADNINVSNAFREGWEPVKAEDYPEVKVLNDRNSQFTGSVEIGGLLLCKMPKEMTDQRAAHFAKLAASQVESVDNNFMKTNDPRMPLFVERKSTTSFGRGAK